MWCHNCCEIICVSSLLCLANKSGSKRNRNRFPDPLPSLQHSFLLELSQTGPGIEHHRITNWRQVELLRVFFSFFFFSLLQVLQQVQTTEPPPFLSSVPPSIHLCYYLWSHVYYHPLGTIMNTSSVFLSSPLAPLIHTDYSSQMKGGSFSCLRSRIVP